MKNAMAWAKTNWMIVVLTVVAILVLPGLWVVSSMMNDSLRASHQQKLDAAMKPLISPNVTYSITTPEGTKIEELNVPPTAQTTAWYSKQWEKLKGEMDKVGGAAESFNKDGHKVLVDGLFPKPAPVDDVFKRREMAKQFKLQHATEGPLLSGINAGTPASTQQLAEMLTEFNNTKREQYKNERNTDPDETTLKQWQDEMLQMRLGQYQLRGRQISLYGDEYAFTVLPNVQYEPTLAQCWDLQEQFWIHQDILAAIKLANSGVDGGQSAGVEESVVKRVLSVRGEDTPYAGAIEPVAGAKPAEQPAAAPAGGDGRGPAGPGGAQQLDFNRGSVTGRVGGTNSGNFYDVRTVKVTVVADAERLPAFFDALTATNFMTVIDVDLKSVDTAADLKDGYFYGTSPVVEATMVVETIWLRSWRVPMMPASVKTHWQLPLEQPADPAAGGAGNGPAGQPGAAQPPLGRGNG